MPRIHELRNRSGRTIATTTGKVHTVPADVRSWVIWSMMVPVSSSVLGNAMEFATLPASLVGASSGDLCIEQIGNTVLPAEFMAVMAVDGEPATIRTDGMVCARMNAAICAKANEQMIAVQDSIHLREIDQLLSVLAGAIKDKVERGEWPADGVAGMGEALSLLTIRLMQVRAEAGGWRLDPPVTFLGGQAFVVRHREALLGGGPGEELEPLPVILHVFETSRDLLSEEA